VEEISASRSYYNFSEMPSSKRRTTKSMKPRVLTEGEQQLRDQCDLLLQDYDKQTEILKAEATREMKIAQDSVDKLFKLEMMKIPKDDKNMLWEDYFQKHGGAALSVSEAIASVVDDPELEKVESKVFEIKAAMGKKGKKRNPSGRSGSRGNSGRKASNDSIVSSGKVSSATPASSQVPKAKAGLGKTPTITPKFDTRSLGRTVTRTAKTGEVLVSLSGSPVTPMVAGGSRIQGFKGSGKKEVETAEIPLGGGTTLNVPITEDSQGIVMPVDLDPEQLGKIQELHKSLGNMLKMRDQAEDLVNSPDLNFVNHGN